MATVMVSSEKLTSSTLPQVSLTGIHHFSLAADGLPHPRLRLTPAVTGSRLKTRYEMGWIGLFSVALSATQLLYYPPYHSKYNPIERCWGILELHWNGAKLIDVETMLAWAQSMTWKGLQPIIQLSRKVYEKGISLTKKAMRQIEKRLERNPLLPKWDIMIKPIELVKSL